MEFDYTYIDLFGFRLFEPGVVVTNFTLFILGIVFFGRLRKYEQHYASAMGSFMLHMGFSTLVGALGHAAHLQLGPVFFKTVLYLSNGFSLVAVYYFLSANLTLSKADVSAAKRIRLLCILGMVIVLFLSCLSENFIFLKITAGLILIYGLITNLIYSGRDGLPGSRWIVWGIVLSFVSIAVHSMRVTLHEWFNHKDLAHVLMIASLVVVYKGADKNSGNLAST